MKTSLLPAYNSAQNYGFFGYAGWASDLAIRQDNPDMLQECLDRDFIDLDSEVLITGNILTLCELRGYEKCAALLRSLKDARDANKVTLSGASATA